MKIKRIIVVVVAAIVLAFFFRSWIYQQVFHYSITGFRNEYPITEKELVAYIESNTSEFEPAKVEDIIELSLELTSDKLEYRMARNDNDPNKLIRTKKAHCVGYSGFFSSVCNYLLVKYGYTDWVAKPLAGNIYFLSLNIHSYIKSSFFKDHDFNIIENKKSKRRLFTDPTLNDYLSIDYVKADR